MTVMTHPLARSLQVAAALGEAVVYMCPRRGLSFDTACADLVRALFDANATTPALLVDGARGGAVLEHARQLGLAALPLYPADVEAELMSVAPRLIAIPDAAALTDLFAHFWEQGVASCVLSDADLPSLHAHLARQVYAETPEGEICVLRFHDPRVLRRLRAVLEEDQCDELFGGVISAFLYEDGTGRLGRFDADPEKARYR